MHFFEPNTLFMLCGDMHMSVSEASEEQTIQEFRQLFLKQSLAQLSLEDQGGGSPLHWLTARASLAGERIAGELERPSMVFLTVCFSLTMLFTMLIPRMYDSSISTNGTTSTVGAISDSQGKPNPEAEPSSPAHRLTAKSTAFILRVGSFRDPVNAQRVVESLRQRTLNVKIETLASGLHVVTVGPFAARNIAEHTARSVSEAVGVVPQILSTANLSH
jgi:hypothetical protein